MNSLFRPRSIRLSTTYSLFPRPLSLSTGPRSSYHVGKASSVNTAIHRGLRKSKGVGFRGSQKVLSEDARDTHKTRTGLPACDVATGNADLARRYESRSSPRKDRPARENSWSSRGVKDSGKHSTTGSPFRSEPILRSKDVGDADIRGRFGEKLKPRIRKFEQNGRRSDRGSSYKERNQDQSVNTSTPRFGSGPDTRSFGSSRPDYHSNPQDSNSRNSYPLLSSRERGSRSAYQTRGSSEGPAYGRNSGARYGASSQSNDRLTSECRPSARFGIVQSDETSRFDTRATHGRTSETFDSKFNRPDREPSSRHSFGPFEARSSTPPVDRVHSDSSNSSGRTSDSFRSNAPPPMPRMGDGNSSRGATEDHARGSSERSVKLDRREASSSHRFDGKRKDGRSPSTPRVSQVFDKHIPLSIPYTTPASEFLYGTSVVEAAIKSRRRPKRKLYKLYIYTGENREDAERDSRMERFARKNGVEVVRVGNEWVRLMDKMSAGRPHNGYILEASPLPRLPITNLGKYKSDDGGFEVSVDHQSREEAAVNGTSNFIQLGNIDGRKPLVLLLDSIVDPGNLGGIIRTASFLGVSAIAISARNSASFTPVVLKASAGASENITLFLVNKPAGFIVDSKEAGWRVYAAVAPSKRNDPSMPEPLSTDDLGDPLSEAPCILMLGSEGEGLRWNLRSKADVDLYIKGSGQSFNVDSLNVSVATGILCNSFLSKRGRKLRVSASEDSGTEEPSAEEPVQFQAATSEGALF